MNVIEYFDQVRIINMTSRKDRRDETVSEFIRYGFPVNSEKVKFYDAITPVDAKRFPNPGVRGCFLSHLSVLKDAERAKSNNILVLEDDIQFSKNILQQGALAVKSLSGLDWDIAYFGHVLKSTTSETTWKKVNQPMSLSHFYAVNGEKVASLTQFLDHLLERPIGHISGGPMHYDGALNTYIKNQPNIQAYYFSMNLGYQRPSKTNLHKNPFFESYTALKPLVILARKIKAEFFRIIR
jgi:glycosyl transferase family 25